jgi:hypothetical protein
MQRGSAADRASLVNLANTYVVSMDPKGHCVIKVEDGLCAVSQLLVPNVASGHHISLALWQPEVSRAGQPALVSRCTGDEGRFDIGAIACLLDDNYAHARLPE